MAKGKRARVQSPFQLQPLEPRLLLSATPDQIAQALDLPAGATVSYQGNPDQAQVRTLYAVKGLLGFPAGDDADFLILSTGIASQVDTVPNLNHNQGTDLGGDGVADNVSLQFTLNVPQAKTMQVLRFEFMFLSEEADEWIGSAFDDSFTVTVEDGGAQPLASVNHDFPSKLDTTGTFFDNRTEMITASYVVPADTATVHLTLALHDVSDAIYDSAVLLDDVRFEQLHEQVYLNFDGKDVGNLFGWGTDVVLPAFQSADLRRYDPRQDVIDEIVAGVQAKFSDFNIQFVTTPPAEGPYNTMVIGGSGLTPMYLAPILQSLKNLPSDTDIQTYTGPAIPPYTGPNILGMVDGVDSHNAEHDNLAAVLSGEFSFYGDNGLDCLVNEISHEVGHMLGLADVTDVDDLMSPDPDSSSAASPPPQPTLNKTFKDADMTLADAWVGDPPPQNDFQYLGALALGLADGTLSDSDNVFTRIMPTPVNLSPGRKLYDVTLVITSPTLAGPRASDDPSSGFIKPGYVHLDSLIGTTQVNLPLLTTDATVTLYAASRKGGPIDIVSGTPTAPEGVVTPVTMPVVGALSYDDAQVDPFATAGLPLALRRSDGRFQQIGVGHHFLRTFEVTTLSLTASDYYSATAVNWLDGGGGTFTDSDGDVYTVKLQGPGCVSVVLDDPDGNGQGPISHILLENTTDASTLAIKVKKVGNGDGIVPVDEIVAPKLNRIAAADSDLTGKGIQVTGLLGALRIRDIADASAVVAGGGTSDRSTLRARRIEDDVEIVFGDKITSFAASTVGDSSIEAAGIGVLFVGGDFAADVSLGLTPGVACTLGAATIAGDMNGSEWLVASGKAGSFAIAGTVNNCEIRTGGDLRAFSAYNMTGSNLYVGVRESFTALEGSNGELPDGFSQMDQVELGKLAVGKGGFSDSNIAAWKISSATIKGEIESDGALFGLSAQPIKRLKLEDDTPSSDFRS